MHAPIDFADVPRAILNIKRAVGELAKISPFIV